MNEIIILENLTIEEKINILKHVKLGQFHSFTTKKVDMASGYYRITIARGKLCDYETMASTIEKRKNGLAKKTSGNGNVEVIINNVLYYFKSTNHYNLSVKSIGGNGKHSSTTYYDNNGNQISREDYEKVVKLDHKPMSEVWYITIDNLIAIK